MSDSRDRQALRAYLEERQRAYEAVLAALGRATREAAYDEVCRYCQGAGGQHAEACPFLVFATHLERQLDWRW